MIKYDYAWVVVREPDMGTENVRFTPTVLDLMNMLSGATPVSLYDYHKAGVEDTLLLLEMPEAARLCSEMPISHPAHRPEDAFSDEREQNPSSESKRIGVRDVRVGDKITKVIALQTKTFRLESGPNNHENVPIHRELDLLTSQGRLPALCALTSARVIKCSPIRRIPNVGLVLNLCAAKQHMEMVLEAPLQLMEIDGLANHQESFKGGNAVGLDGFQADAKGGEEIENNDPEQSGVTTRLPQSIDVVLLAWVADITSRSYNDTYTKRVQKFNAQVRSAKGALGEIIEEEDMPQQPMCCSGYPIPLFTPSEAESKGGGDSGASSSSSNNNGRNAIVKRTYDSSPESFCLMLLSHKVRRRAKQGIRKVEVSGATGNEAMQNAVLRNQVAVALGRPPTEGDLKAYKQQQKGSSYLWGVSGDLHAYSTWSKHAESSMIGRGMSYGRNDWTLRCVTDNETLLMCRTFERLAQTKDTPESSLAIEIPTRQTYTAVREMMRKQRDEDAKRADARARGEGEGQGGAGEPSSSSSSSIPELDKPQPKRSMFDMDKQPDDPIASLVERSKRVRHGQPEEEQELDGQFRLETRNARNVRTYPHAR